MNRIFKLLLIFLIALTAWGCNEDNKPRRLELFFLGHDSKHHDSELLADILSKEYFEDGINITYSNDPEDLLRPDLEKFDGLILYANHDTISSSQAKALLDYVASGKGFIPIHSASFCFRNSDEVVKLIGGQFKSHEGGSFGAEIIKPEHPAMQGLSPFVTEWDETYVHHLLADDIDVLMERVDTSHREPYTWVKDYGKGRVFYTAFGHDERTFRNPGFIKLVKNGILWAVGEKAVDRMKKYVIAKPTYEEARMPNYERRNPPPRYQHPLSPEESQTLVQVPVGFRLELFASEPEIKKPIAMDWDERGRLWIIETIDYPNTVKSDKGKGGDRITICEDTDNDGKADKFTVFAEGLNLPTSLVFADGGVIVAQAPHFLFLKDTNGDDKADVRKVLIDGWGTFDTHAGPSNLKYGIDNKIWGTVGYSGFEGTIAGKPLKFGSGAYKFDPLVKDFEYLGNTTNNTWGLGFSEDADVFISTANNEHSNFLAISARYYEKANLRERGIEKIDGHYKIHELTKELRQVDVFGGFTAATGHNLYTARAFPKEYWNRVAFIAEPTGRLIHRHILEQHGSGFKEKGDGWNVVASSDNWFGPVEAKVGPDGSLWFLDWYNFIIQHNPTPEGFDNGEGNAYIDPLRDNKKGRIYRLVYEDAGKQKTYKLDRKKTSDLLNALESDNMFWRLTAQRLLVEGKDKSVAKSLHKLIGNKNVDEVNVNGGAIHAIWTLHGLGLLSGEDDASTTVVLEALRHPAAGVRKAAIQALPNTPENAQKIISSGMLTDKDLRVRLAAILYLADSSPSPQIGKAIFEAVQQPENEKDKWLFHSLLIAGAVHQQAFVDEYQNKLGNLDLSNVSGSLAERIILGNNMTVFSSGTSFSGVIPPNQVPDLSGQEIHFTAAVKQKDKKPKEGVLMSYGNKTNGYIVFVKDGNLQFRVNQMGRQSIIKTTKQLPAAFNVKTSLLSDGKMVINIDGNKEAEGQSSGTFKEKPNGFIMFGKASPSRGNNKDFTDSPGDFSNDFNFTGELEDARLVAMNKSSASQTETTLADKEIKIKTVINKMEYDVNNFSVKAGSTLKIVFENPDHMQHNILILKQGSLERVGKAADELATQQNAAELQYIPNSTDVLFSTPLVDPGKTFELNIKVPNQVGDYPFACTFPGHWRIMNGVMKVTK
ncbi:PVC-type heme-binding CxxCH protein [Sphingobacterium endophyticum]|uniref:PVC-type heme-binding CxxCH protein n=1 Tax=Sphingobacterium endophyticum TaxID=2546448 RepID=UPI0018CEFA1E|nr:PVC-type heme-binding CxxCH protein [Sphingobacterium endophyticum]